MPCLIGCLAFFTPRLAIVLVVIFSDYIGQSYETRLWPFLGFLFAPMTTLAYAWAAHADGVLHGGAEILVLVVAVLCDLGVIGSGAAKRGKPD